VSGLCATTKDGQVSGLCATTKDGHIRNSNFKNQKERVVRKANHSFFLVFKI